MVAPPYFHFTGGVLEGSPGLRADTAEVQMLLPPGAVEQDFEEIDYELKYSATEIVATGSATVDPATGSFIVPVAGTLTRSRIFFSVTARGPAAQEAPAPPPGVGTDVGELFTATGSFSVYASGPPSDSPVALSPRPGFGSEITRYTSTQGATAAGPGDTIIMTVPVELTEISDLRARIAGIDVGVSRTGDPKVAVVTIPLDYYETGQPGDALLVLGGYAGNHQVEHVVPVIMGNVPPAATVDIVPDADESATGNVVVVASPVSAGIYRILVTPRSGAAVRDTRHEVAAGQTLSIPFTDARFPNRLTVYEIDVQDGDREVSTMVGEYAPPGAASAKTVIDSNRPERSNLYLDNRNQFGENRFTGEVLSRVFEVTVDGVRTDYTLKGGATLRVPLTTAQEGTTIVVVVDGVTIWDEVIPTTGISVPAGRVAGADRYEVATNVSQLSYPDGAETVVLVSGQNFSDALSAAPLATHSEAPLLLTTAAGLPDAVRSEITRLSPSKIVVVGGPNSVSNAVLEDLREDFSVQRISGADRFEVSRNVAKTWMGESPTTVYAATGFNFPDALSAGAAAGALDSPVVLVAGTSVTLDAPTDALLRSLQPQTISIAGGPASVSSGIETALASIAQTTRYGGADRFEASVAINRSAFPTSQDAFLVTGLNYPDALSGGAWAGAQQAPLYLSTTECVPESVIAAMNAQGVVDVTLIGGPASLSPAVENITPC
ncbi:cell wall-binding repeat-containing protein [Herbiconiux sp. P15]|uniref:cell wall-binding repeat-containing protein n=1 Tax=Herbiconiux liukaitaii TaxID=3342799 RepID=UPI0035B86B7A